MRGSRHRCRVNKPQYMGSRLQYGVSKDGKGCATGPGAQGFEPQYGVCEDGKGCARGPDAGSAEPALLQRSSVAALLLGALLLLGLLGLFRLFVFSGLLRRSGMARMSRMTGMAGRQRRLVKRTGRTGTRRTVHGAGRDEQGQHQQPHAPESAFHKGTARGLHQQRYIFSRDGKAHAALFSAGSASRRLRVSSHGSAVSAPDQRRNSGSATRVEGRHPGSEAEQHPGSAPRPTPRVKGRTSPRSAPWAGTPGRSPGSAAEQPPGRHPRSAPRVSPPGQLPRVSPPGQRRQMTLKSQKRHVSVSAHWRKGCVGSKSSASVSRTSSSKRPS